MMKKRTDRILAGLAVLQVLLIALAFWPRPAAFRVERLFPDLTGSAFVALTVTGEDGQSVTLRQKEGTWVLPDADDYPAQASKVVPLLEKIAALTTENLVARTSASHRQLKVAEDAFVRRLDLEKADGGRIRLYLGTSPRLNSVHLRLDGRDETYLAQNLSTTEIGASASAWVDPIYFSLPMTEVVRFRLENAQGVLTLTREAENAWNLAGLGPEEKVDPTRVDSFLRQATSIRMLEPLGRERKPEYGMETPTAVLTLWTKEREITLTVGAPNEKKTNYILASSESPYYVRVAAYTVRDLVEKGRSDFLAPPPTPTPTPTPEVTPTPMPATMPPPTSTLTPVPEVTPVPTPTTPPPTGGP